MQPITYFLLLSFLSAFLSGCGPGNTISPDAQATAKEESEEEKAKKEAEERDNEEEVVVVDETVPPAPPEVVPGPFYPPYPYGGGGLYGSGGGGGNGSHRISLSVEKIADVDSLVAGETITYTITVVNNGSFAISGIQVVESAFSGIGDLSDLNCLPAQPASLAPGAEMVCTATYTVQQGDVDALTLSNAVEVNGVDSDDNPVTDNDIIVLPALLDFGDAPNTYGTLLGSDGARHSVPGYTSQYSAPLRLGSSIDIENNGAPNVNANGDDLATIDDENGLVDLSANPISSISVTSAVATQVNISATNTSSNAATLAGWIDFDGSGTFEAGERQIIAVPANSGTQIYSLSFAATNVASGSSFARFRLFPGTVVAPSPTGPATNGEVEDYPVTLTGAAQLDFGDAPDTFGTLLASDGARHEPLSYDVVNRTASLMLGSSLDIEANGVPGLAATGDDLLTVDDEESVSAPINVTLSVTVPTIIVVSVTNNTASVATLAGWIDLNYSGTFETSERGILSIPANSGTANYNLVIPAITSNPPVGFSFARLRLFSGTVAAPSPTGYASSGEVEDYPALLGIP